MQQTSRQAMNKAVDSWWTVIAVDPLATRLVRLVGRRAAITPTRVTLAAFAIGLLSATAFALDWHAVGAVLFEVRFLLDCVDGKLARHRGASSQAGAFVDVGLDMLVVGLCYATLTASVIDADGWERFPLVIGVGLVTAASWAQTYRRLMYGENTRSSTPADAGSEPGWFERRRLKSYPSAVEAETAALFLAPLVLADGGIVVVLLAVYAFYLLSVVDSFRRIYRRARAEDRAEA